MNKNRVMIRENLHTIYLKITTLSPIHIGIGEVYEPTNYVIENGKLYQFDEVLFYQGLSSLDRKSFNGKLQNYMQMIDFYKSKKEEAKEIAHFECAVSKKVENQYNKQTNKDGTRNKNQLQIERTFKNPNTHRAIIPASSIKGMLETAMNIYVNPPRASNEVRQRLMLSDAMLLKGAVEIGIANRRHRNPSKSSKDGIYQIIEVIEIGSEFILSIKTEHSFNEIKRAMREYHNKRTNSRYQETESSFVARVGKNVGMDYMVDVKDVSQLKNRDRKPLATHFLYDGANISNEEFGWVKFELIDSSEYQSSLQSISTQERAYYDELEEKQHEIKFSIQKAKEERLALKAEKEAEEKAKVKVEAEAKAKREAELAQMSSLDKKIDKLILEDKSSTPKSTLILTAIKNDYFEENELKEVLEKLKTIMQDEGKWKEKSTAKKPEKDKVYKRTLEVMKMMKS